MKILCMLIHKYSEHLAQWHWRRERVADMLSNVYSYLPRPSEWMGQHLTPPLGQMKLHPTDSLELHASQNHLCHPYQSVVCRRVGSAISPELWCPPTVTSDPVSVFVGTLLLNKCEGREQLGHAHYHLIKSISKSHGIGSRRKTFLILNYINRGWKELRA